MLEVSLDTFLNTFHLTLDFHAEPGRTTVLLGESGAGKSTVLRLLAGLLHPQKGHIAIDKEVYFDSVQRIVVPPQARPFGYVFQDYVLFPHLTVFENVAFGLRAQHLAQNPIRQRVGAVLEQMHLTGMEQRRPSQLSGGQQQRVAIARALALQPQLLLLDEPLSALDVQTRRKVRQELLTLLAQTRVTTVMVTHSYLEALLFGQQILVLEAGKVIQQGGQQELREYPRSSYVAELVGLNFFQGRIVRYESETTGIIQLSYGPEIVATLKERVPDGSTPPLGSHAHVVVNPHSITLHARPPEGSARNSFRGRILHLLHIGAAGEESRVRVNIALEGYISSSTLPPLTAEITEASVARMELVEGKQIYATFKGTEAAAYV